MSVEFGFFEGFEELLAIGWVAIYVLTLVSSCGDVVDGVFELDSDGSCHAGILRRNPDSVTSQELTPYPSEPPKYIVHDADTKFTRDFRKMLKSQGVKPVRIGPWRPNMNAIAERYARTIQEECLDRFLVFGEDHLRYLISSFVEYYHTKRTHRGLKYRTPGQIDSGTEADDVPLLSGDDLAMREALGGALKWYERKAA